MVLASRSAFVVLAYVCSSGRRAWVQDKRERLGLHGDRFSAANTSALSSCTFTTKEQLHCMRLLEVNIMLMFQHFVRLSVDTLVFHLGHVTVVKI